MSETTQELISATIQRLSDAGRSGATIETYQTAYNSLVRFCESNGIETYSPEVGETFLKHYLEINPSIKQGKISAYRTGIKHLDCTFLNVDMKKGPFGRSPIPYEDSRFNAIRDEYKKYLDKTGRTQKDVRSRILCVSRFLKFAEGRGIKALSDLSANDVYAAFYEATDKGRFRRLVGHFLTYAHKYGLTGENLYLFIPFPVRHKAIPSTFSPDEVERIIASIDRSTSIGKRNYAIVLIAARLGIRASDIAGLTFDSIMVQEGKIRIKRQQKTKTPLTLPLLDEVLEAISDYVYHARQESDDEHIFLNVDCFITSYNAFAKYLISVGIPAYIHPHALSMKYSKYVPYIFSDGDMARLFSIADSGKSSKDRLSKVQFPLLLRILYGCGLRLGEALALQLRDIDLESGTLLVRNGKGDKDRLVPMDNSLTSILKMYCTALLLDKPGDAYLFESNYKDDRRNCVGHHRSQSWARSNFRNILKLAGISILTEKNERGICPHCLRHTVVDHSLAKQNAHGISNYHAFPLISVYLGHEDLTETQDYVHLTTNECNEIIKKTAEKYGSIFPEVPK